MLTSGVCYSFVDPALDSLEASPFWHPGLCPYVLQADHYREEDQTIPYILDLAQLNCEVISLRQSPNLTHYVFKKGGKSLQLCYQAAGDAAIHSRHLRFILRMGNRLNTVEENLAVKRLKHLVKTGRICDRLFKTNTASVKFHRQLQVMAQVTNKRPRQEIAEIFFDNKDRIRQEISDPESHVNNIVGYALDKAEDLMNGAYVKYLKKLDS
ncbi:hypothetical protein [Paremcibacter congregatus]|uniref:Uncharacterized protein n=1 Tax=Paremcibacter congregatus TaxID=2043170 RepID=A0A2G4YWP9_9PROT|nr:hypothetical protein [Paremcibacter congregatus]PHZ86767.1 hypothetical protein CRD36_00025 [Paremcibacter congregatus]QDE26271.1 hypothetical protein FIV45_02740 [Paremcibacter congregatus]QDE28022.1 hypothetical protein FIV45_12430 [Paremcibacter congregatus]